MFEPLVVGMGGSLAFLLPMTMVSDPMAAVLLLSVHQYEQDRRQG